VVEDNSAICTGEIITLFLLVASTFFLRCPVLVDGFQLETSDLMDLDRKNATGVSFRRRRGDEQLILPFL
jgi:hypothetical protein